MASRKIYYDLEKIFKGISNHRRIEIIALLSKEPDLSTEGVVGRLKINYYTGSQHVRKLVQSGLVNDYRKGNATLHKLTPLGKSILYFAQNIK